jgi:hypothetical protein
MTTVMKSPPPEIKNAIKVLIRRGADQENLKIIEDALSNPEIDNRCWLELFDAQGAKDAVEKSFYSPEMIRLLTLQAMISPLILPQLLDWLGQKKETDNIYQICHKFQSEVRDSLKTLPTIEKNILTGVTILIPELLDHPERLSTTAWLLKDQKGCWSELYRRVVRNKLDYTLNNYSKNKIIFESTKWDNLVKELTIVLQSEQSKILKHYRIFGDLFYLIHDHEIAIIFYHISVGRIPKKVFNSLVIDDSQISNPKVYGVAIKPQYNFFDVVFKFFSLLTSLILGVISFLFTAIKFLFVFTLIFGLSALELLVFITLMSEIRGMTADEFIEVAVSIMLLRFIVSVIVVIMFGLYRFISSLFPASPT